MEKKPKKQWQRPSIISTLSIKLTFGKGHTGGDAMNKRLIGGVDDS